MRSRCTRRLRRPGWRRWCTRPGPAAGIRRDRAMDGLIDYAGRDYRLPRPRPSRRAPERGSCALLDDRPRRAAGRRPEPARRLENLAPLYPGPETRSASPMRRALVRRLDFEGIGICLDVGTRTSSPKYLARSLHRAGARLRPCSMRMTTSARGAGSACRRSRMRPAASTRTSPPGRGSLPWHTVGSLISGHRAPVVLEAHPPYRPRAAELREDAALLISSP